MTSPDSPPSPSTVDSDSFSVDSMNSWGVVGNPAAVKYLSASLQASRLSHAYLITGPDQIGRKTFALGLARAVNCLSTDGAPPCNRCRSCDRTARGIHSDVRVVNVHTPIRGTSGADESTDAQDERRRMLSIEHIRDMQRDASLNPFEGRRQIFIIEQADTLMFPDGLATPAANALLKTLEEPAPTVIVVLIASDRRAVPETVASRCQSIELRPVPADVITTGLIAHRGTHDDEAARVARICEGRPGRAIELLEDPAALSRYQQTVMRVLEASTSSLEERFRYARDLSAVYRRDREAVEAELKIWSGVWRDILLASNGLGRQVLHEDWRETINAIAAAITNAQIVDALQGLENATNALARNAVAQLALEVMMLDLPAIAGGIDIVSSVEAAPHAGEFGDQGDDG